MNEADPAIGPGQVCIKHCCKPKCSAFCADEGEDTLARALKRPRLVWTPKLHQRFVEAVEQLGLKIAVPKTIMQVLSHKLLLLSHRIVASATALHKTFANREVHLITLFWDSCIAVL